MAILSIAFLLLTFGMPFIFCSERSSKRPNILFYLADDLGWSDVSFHGSKQVPTVNIDALARDGIILNHYYVQFVCSPSRGALMTGKYPIRFGFQHSVLTGGSPWGLPLKEKILPQFLKEAYNYATHGVGKWHLGFFKSPYLPQNRGFDSWFGYWNGVEDYFDHFSIQKHGYSGLDLHHNCVNQWSYNGTYGPDMYARKARKIIREHDAKRPLFLYFAQQSPHSGNFDVPNGRPLQSPKKYTKRLVAITNKGRHTFAGMVSSADHALGEVVDELHKKGMLDNTIIIFSTDNGGAVEGLEGTYGSNFPLRGSKHNLFEGGVRGVSFIWSTRLRQRSRIYDGLMHITDWLPTILSAVGGSKALEMLKHDTIDGLDHWASLSKDRPSPRHEVLLNIDNVNKAAGIRRDNFKLVTGTYRDGEFDGYYNQGGMPLKDHPSMFTPSQQLAYNENYAKFLKHSKVAKILKEKYGRSPSLAAYCQTPNCKRQLEIDCGPRPRKNTCHVTKRPCLFDIRSDPCELFNLASLLPQVVQSLNSSINRYIPDIAPPGEKPLDPKAKPKYHGDAWVTFDSDCCRTRGVCMSGRTNTRKKYPHGP